MAESGTSALRPRLVVRGAAEAIDYYKQVFGAEEIERYTDANGMIVHAELAIGNVRLTLKEEDGTDRIPTSPGDSPVLLMLDVGDVDAVAERMVAGGGTVIFPVADSEHGRGGRYQDPFGHAWMISQPTGDQRRHAQLPRPRLCYLEIPATDVGGAAAFYEAVFGWEIRDGDGDRPAFTDAAGDVSGAWVRDRAVSREPGLLPYIWVDDIDSTLGAVTAHDGEVVDAPALDTGSGGEWIATFRDPAGNLIGLYQEGPRR